MTGEREAQRSIRFRRLTAEEEELWSTVARSIKPLRDKAVPVRHAREGARSLPKAAARPGTSAPASRVIRPSSAGMPTLIALRERQRLARGRAEIAARIDLHGLTQAEAHATLLPFLRRAQAGGAKFVLVVTGKGAPDLVRGTERGVLRRQVPLWLSLPEFRSLVLGFDRADSVHGGEGALYVRLRPGVGRDPEK
jgi:DNA-nicking Smr family endonuclease